MEALFTQHKGNFHNAQTHIATLRREPSAATRALIEADIASASWWKFTVWDVPRMMSVVGCHAAVDVLGHNVFVEEAEIKGPDIPIGVFRHSMMFGVSRQASGGKRLYDFTNMNVSLALAWVGGAGAIFAWKRTVPKRMQFVRVPIGFLAFLCLTPVVKFLWKGAGIATLYVDYHSRKATMSLKCEHCLEEMTRHTTKQIADRGVDKITGNQKQQIYDSMRTDLSKMKELAKTEKFKAMTCGFHEAWKK